MRAFQKLLIGWAVGSVAAAAACADDAGGGAGPGGSVFEAWPDLDAPAALLPVYFSDAGDDGDAGDAGDDGDSAPFSKGTWALQLTGSYYWSITGSEVEMPYGSVNVSYYYADTWAVDVHASGYALRENGQSEGFAASIGLNLRKHFFIRDPWSVYIDGGMGMIRADGQFPDGGTNTNFTLQGGLGATYRLSESLHLVGGARWFHISNARRHGEDGNMSTDGPAVYAGLMWTW